MSRFAADVHLYKPWKCFPMANMTKHTHTHTHIQTSRAKAMKPDILSNMHVVQNFSVFVKDGYQQRHCGMVAEYYSE